MTSLKGSHSLLTASGNVSHHSSGNAVDVAQINGVPIYGHQEPGGVTDQAVRRLMRLQGTMRPDLIARLREIDNPVVPTEPSKYSLPADKPASQAHDGE